MSPAADRKDSTKAFSQSRRLNRSTVKPRYKQFEGLAELVAYNGVLLYKAVDLRSTLVNSSVSGRGGTTVPGDVNEQPPYPRK